MQNSQPDRARKRKLLRRVRRQRLKYITILPSLITLLNGACGFAAIGFASKAGSEHFQISNLDNSNFAWAAYMIFIAMIADMLDGRVARMSQTTSSFGGQLDSLCDVISFGVAPAFLTMKILNSRLRNLINPAAAIDPFVVKFIWVSAAFYMACAAIRLARFNVENEEDETSHMSFIGLPTPAAAGVLASLVLFWDYILPVAQNSPLVAAGAKTIILVLPFITIITAILMISRIRYPHLVNQYLKGRKPLEHLIWSIIIIGLIWSSVQTGLVISFCGFAFMGLGNWLWYKMRSMKASLTDEPEPPVLSVTHPPQNQNQ